MSSTIHARSHDATDSRLLIPLPKCRIIRHNSRHAAFQSVSPRKGKKYIARYNLILVRRLENTNRLKRGKDSEKSAQFEEATEPGLRSWPDPAPYQGYQASMPVGVATPSRH